MGYNSVADIIGQSSFV